MIKIVFKNGQELELDINMDIKLLMKSLNQECSESDRFIAITKPGVIINLYEILYILELKD